MDLSGIFDDLEADFVGFARRNSRFDSSTGQKHHPRFVPVVAARVQLLAANYSGNHPLDLADESFAFDELGNRLSPDRDYGKTNKLFEDASYTYTYDKEGNLVTAVEKSSGQMTEYTWDYRGRLTSVKKWTSTAKTSLLSQVDYTYDALDRRITKSVNTDGQGTAEIVEKFVYDGQHIAMVFDVDNTLTHRYMHGPGIDMILADEAFDGSGNFLDLYWMLGDHQGSVTSVLTHDSGQTSLVQQLAYTAFGSIGSIKDGQGNNVTAGPIPRFAYTGREFDPETGDYFYRARYYDPQTGRFLSQDPIGFAAGDMNLYRYVGNATPNAVDPSGTVVWFLPLLPVLGEVIIVGGDILISIGLATVLYYSGAAVIEVCPIDFFAEGPTAQDIISKEKKGSILREFPTPLLGKTLAEIEQLAKCGNKDARKAKKLLKDGRFNK